MNTFSSIRQHWQQTLQALYPEREIANLFRFGVEDVFGLTSADQLSQWDDAQPEAVVTQLEAMRARLETGEPLQYITGFTYFDDLKIAVSPAVLIPRPETEELVEWVSASLDPAFAGTITDWCTGSGCIALALKNRFPQATVNGLDWSGAALEMARTNAEALSLDVPFELQDALSAAISAEPVDVIVSNPPYIPEREVAEMRENVRAFEPHMALFVPNEQALVFYEAITQKAVQQLPAGGQLFFELHEAFAVQTKALVDATGAFHPAEIKEDIYGKQRMLRAVRS